MGELIGLLGVLSGANNTITVVAAVTTIGVVAYLLIRKSNMDTATSVTSQQQAFMASLTSQNVRLTAEVSELQKRVAEMLEKLEDLRSENARQGRHIEALEDLMRRYVVKCVECPHYNQLVDHLKDLKVDLND